MSKTTRRRYHPEIDPKRQTQLVRRWDFTVNRHPWWEELTPPQLFVGSFALLIALGTVGMKCLPGLFTAEPLTWEESLFTCTSAVCVTGLTVIDPGTRLTMLGQAYLLLLIQLGGLGMIVFTSLILFALGKRLSLRHESLANAAAEGVSTIEPRKLVVDIVCFTFLIEGVGAGLLYLTWAPRLGWQGAVWPAIFHSISAFCNAGFSTFSDQLIGFQESPATLIVISFLIIAGGIGFLTMEELAPFVLLKRRQFRPRVSLQTRLVLYTTALLLVGGTVAFAILEWNQTLDHLPPVHRLTNAMFLSVTARTAGFNSIDYAEAPDSTNFLTILLMMIGGSPGSTAGGIKTTTFALLGLMAWSRLKGDDSVQIFGRSLRKETTDRAVSLSVIAISIVVLGILALSVSERWNDSRLFLDHTFEVVSAFNTVGLSMGISANLSSAGRGIIIALMFVGRVGPLSAASALARPGKRTAQFRYAYEDVMIG